MCDVIKCTNRKIDFNCLNEFFRRTRRRTEENLYEMGQQTSEKGKTHTSFLF